MDKLFGASFVSCTLYGSRVDARGPFRLLIGSPASPGEPVPILRCTGQPGWLAARAERGGCVRCASILQREQLGNGGGLPIRTLVPITSCPIRP